MLGEMLYLTVNQAFVDFPSHAELADCGAGLTEIRDAVARADVAVAGAMPLLDADLEDEPIS
eukprot:2100318-Pyramimonas_sp.AAC.1